MFKQIIIIEYYQKNASKADTNSIILLFNGRKSLQSRYVIRVVPYLSEQNVLIRRFNLSRSNE